MVEPHTRRAVPRHASAEQLKPCLACLVHLRLLIDYLIVYSRRRRRRRPPIVLVRPHFEDLSQDECRWCFLLHILIVEASQTVVSCPSLTSTCSPAAAAAAAAAPL